MTTLTSPQRHESRVRKKHILSAKGESPNLPKGSKLEPAAQHVQVPIKWRIDTTKHLAPSNANTWRPALGRVWSGLSNVVWYIYLWVYVWVHVYSIPICIPYGYSSRYGSHSYSHSCSYVFFYLSPYSYVIILCWRCITCFPPWASCQDCCCPLERQPKGFTNLIQSVSPHHSHSQECLAAQYAAPARGVLKW